jgi:N-glycosylase/DNA lyase
MHLRSLGADGNLENLSQVDSMLMECPGIGRKVADCIALFSLDQHGAIPVDTHVWEIAIRDYSLHLQQSKSLTPKIYTEVGDTFRERFGGKAGWAHSVLFAAELPEFRRLLPMDSQTLMKDFSEERKRKRRESKLEKISTKKLSSK